MKMKRTTSKEMALCGVLAALALTVMILGGMFPAASYCCPVLACILLVPVVETCGRRIAWAWYGAVALLSCLLCPDPEAAALFLFLGYYPIIKGPLDRISPALLRALAKLALFLVAGAPVCPVPGAGSRNLPPGGPLDAGSRPRLGNFDVLPDRFSADPAGSNVATENREEIGIELGRAVWRIWVRVLRKVCNGTRMLPK